MKLIHKILIIIVLTLIALGLFKFFGMKAKEPAVTTTHDQTISDGTITFAVPSKTFGLAVNTDQILVHSYIPPCSEGFNYCLYYKGSDYTGTNFESAGLRIKKRTDLLGEPACLETPPEGFDPKIMPNFFHSDAEYSSSVFSNVGDAAAGHYAVGSLYRLYVVGKTASCYEFETRVGQTQFSNYPAGAIKEFTDSDLKKVQANLKAILDAVALPSGKNNLFNF